jgi:ATP-dependent Clp protease ATP-binding subunit ClpX
MTKETKQHCSFCEIEASVSVPMIAGAEGHICEACVILASQVVSSWGKKKALSDMPQDLPKPTEIKKMLDQYVIGQDLAKEILAVAVYNHYKRLKHESSKTAALGSADQSVEIGKSNILLIGPSGTGKTLLASTLAKIVGVPFAVATTLTQAGYVGDDVENILVRLLDVANGDINKAEWGIVYLDEVDKIARSPEQAIGTRDVSGEGVQQALLRLVEGSHVKVSLKGRRKDQSGAGGDSVMVDTRNILFISGGAFPGLEKYVEKRLVPGHTAIGFHAEMNASEKPKLEDMLNATQPDDLKKFGLIPEFIGRFPVLAPLEPLDIDALIRVLTEPKNALVKQYQQLFSFDDVALEFTEDALTEIAKQAVEHNTGARGLRGIMEKVLRRIMFDIPSRENVERCIVNADVIKGEQEVEVIEHEILESEQAIQ